MPWPGSACRGVAWPDLLGARVRYASTARAPRVGMTLASGPSQVVRVEAAAGGGLGRRAVKGNM
jgi:hypothetical protein